MTSEDGEVVLPTHGIGDSPEGHALHHIGVTDEEVEELRHATIPELAYGVGQYGTPYS